MEKKYFSRVEISKEMLMQMAKVSALTKQLNSLTLAELAQKQEIVRQLFGSTGSNPFLGDNFHCDFGVNIYVGDNFHADYNCTMLDVSEIHIVFTPKVVCSTVTEYPSLLVMMCG